MIRKEAYSHQVVLIFPIFLLKISILNNKGKTFLLSSKSFVILSVQAVMDELRRIIEDSEVLLCSELC